MSEAASEHASELAEVKQDMKKEMDDEVKRLKEEQRKLEKVTAADVAQLQQLHEQRVSHAEQLLEAETKHLHEVRKKIHLLLASSFPSPQIRPCIAALWTPDGKPCVSVLAFSNRLSSLLTQ